MMKAKTRTPRGRDYIAKPKRSGYLAGFKEHPLLASAKRAIRRGILQLPPDQVFRMAALADPAGQWDLSVTYSLEHPEPYRWKCDGKKGGA
jgi:hypothetical protein